MVATRRTVSVLHGALRRLYIEVERVMRDGDGDADTDDEQQQRGRRRRRSRRTVVTLKRKRGKTKKKAAAEDAVAGIPAAAPRPLLDLEEAGAPAAAEPQMQRVGAEEEANEAN